jgi:hypothetical protein
MVKLQGSPDPSATISEKRVSGPRNQRYLHPRRLSAGVLVCERQDLGEIAAQFYGEVAMLRDEADFIDQVA